MKICQSTKKFTIYKIIKKIKSFVVNNQISINKPFLSKNDVKYVSRSLSRLEISSYGSYTKLFEKKLQKYTKSKFVLCTNSGTSALHLSLLALNINEAHEIFLPSFNFVSSANAIKYCNATPHFLDIELTNLGVDPCKLSNYIKKNFIFKKRKLFNKKTKKHLKAIILVYAYGHPPKIDQLMDICKKYNIKIIEDSAEALGTFYKKKHAGTFGDLGILSFNGNKIITTGAGGAVLTNSEKLFKRVKYLATLSKNKDKIYHYTSVGYNYRMASINASLGLAQLESIEKRVSKRRKIYLGYKKIFNQIIDARLFLEPENARSNFWSQLLILKSKILQKNKQKLLGYLNKNKINSIQGWNLLSQLNYLKKYPTAALLNSKKISKNIINLPSQINNEN